MIRTSGRADEIRVLFLHPPNWSEEQIRLASGKIAAVAAKAASSSPDARARTAAVRVVSAREDWFDHVRVPKPAPRVLNAWIRDVAIGKQLDGQPSYHAFVVPWGKAGPTGPVDLVAAKLIDQAKQAQKPVLTWNPDDDRAAPVTGVATKGRAHFLEVRQDPPTEGPPTEGPAS